MKERIKQLIWNHVPYDVEIMLRACLQPDFRKRHIEQAEMVSHRLPRIEVASRGKSKPTVVFLCQLPSVWSSCASAFQVAAKDSDLDLYLIALPEVTVQESGDVCVDCGADRSYTYCKTFYPDTIQAYDAAQQRWFRPDTLHPDYIVLSRPYDGELPLEYQSDTLSSYAKLCYIPYSYCKMNWDSRVVYNCGLMDHVYAVFPENQLYCKMLQKIFWRTFRADYKEIHWVGYPRFDLYRPKKDASEDGRKTVLWLPRWTTKTLLEPSTFFRYKDALIKFFTAHPQFHLICRPHPLMFSNFLSTGEMDAGEIETFRQMFRKTGNLTLDESDDYIAAFSKADVFISDTSSLLVEEFATGKPVIFCGSMAHFDRDAKKWARLLYHAGNSQELLDRLKRSLEGDDPRENARMKYLSGHLTGDRKSGERIIEFIKSDFRMSQRKVEIQ